MVTAAAPDLSAFVRHGGRVAAARALFPDAPRPWIDLSTGINPRPYPARGDRSAWRRLPDPEALKTLEATAARAFGALPAHVAAVAGSEAALRLLPRIIGVPSVAIPEPTYGGHAEAWRAAGATICPAPAEALVVVNPNNPDGRLADARALIQAAADGAWVIVDEAFADAEPSVSLAPIAAGRLIVLRSFGKFYGLPGLRLGFVVADPAVIEQVRAATGDWPVSSDAIAVGQAAYADDGWALRARVRIAAKAKRLDAVLTGAGLDIVGGTTLFRLARAADAPARFLRLARAGLLCRPFAHDAALLRFGLPGSPSAWARLRSAMGDGHER